MNDRLESGSGRLVRGGGFDFLDAADGLFFVHDGGRRVRTDALGREFWRNLPGERRDVLEKVRETLALPEEMAGNFLDLLIAAGIAQNSAGGAADCGRGGSGDAGLSVSAIVVTHRGAEHIRKCLASLLNQSVRRLEIVVVDNASRDGTADIVASEFPGVRLVRLPKNRHFARGVNRGAAEARGEFLFIVNDDTEVDPECVEILRRKLAGDPEAAAAVPVMRFLDLKNFVNGVGNHIKGKGWGSDNFIGAVDLGAFDALGEVPSACFGAVLVRRADFEESWRLDEAYTAYCEDVDWSFRARLRGRRIVPGGKAVVYHKIGGSAMLDSLKVRLVVRNRLRLVLKLFKKKMRYEYLASYVKEDVRMIRLLASRREWRRVSDYPWAYASLLLSLPGILWKRSKIMRRTGRGVEDADFPGPVEGFPVLTDDDGHPILDAAAYFRHYYWEFDRTRRNARKRRADAAARREG